MSPRSDRVNLSRPDIAAPGPGERWRAPVGLVRAARSPGHPVRVPGWTMRALRETAMRPRRVLVTGVARPLGAQVAMALAADPGVEAVVGVDTTAPTSDLGRTQFVRADIRHPLIAKVISTTEIDTVLHLNVIATPLGAGGRAAMKEINVIGTMQLLAACQKAPSVTKLVVKSTTSIYGSSARDPALFTEDTEPRALPAGGYAKDAVEVEGYVRGFSRRRPDIAVTVLRFTNILGPQIDSPLARYLDLPLVPTVLGFDPRIQLLHSDDALAVLMRATRRAHPGTFNVAGDGVLLLSQAIRRAGRPSTPVPFPAIGVLGGIARRLRLVDFSAEQLDFLAHGRAVDTTRLKEIFGYRPRYSTMETFDSFVRQRGLRFTIDHDLISRAEHRMLDSLARRRLVGTG
ncbi:nucleoside-diphosphate-sugar epimerase [Frankia casuarinae]|nr:nucleoside-diphosphate-sugar epimerase [Frankia casuarinae]KDA42416.1 nucleoside-diphosphate-sugar epimerase [Frankia sp. BMG5.23]KEZ38073.1 nucleoside-diphosphate-sugar epimerase [Frankia sp. CeD]